MVFAIVSRFTGAVPNCAILGAAVILHAARPAPSARTKPTARIHRFRAGGAGTTWRSASGFGRSRTLVVIAFPPLYTKAYVLYGQGVRDCKEFVRGAWSGRLVPKRWRSCRRFPESRRIGVWLDFRSARKSNPADCGGTTPGSAACRL